MPKATENDFSPVGWYIGTYVLRFIELSKKQAESPDSRFLTWENTVIVRAADIKEAFDKIDKIGRSSAISYKGGSKGVPVRWNYEGIAELLPIYEELEDGSEIFWAERRSKKLKNIRSGLLKRGEVGRGKRETI